MGLSMNKETQIRCDKCEGSGLIEMEPVPCEICKGRICMFCERRGGLQVEPYETCNYCYGSGTIEK